MSTITTKVRANDMLDQMGPEMYRRAYDAGMTMSAFLEKEDPSPEYKDGLDAFGRVLKAAGVVTDAQASHGVPASTWEDFNRTSQTRALIHEWAARQWRSAQKGTRYSTRSLYGSSDAVVGDWERPWVDAGRLAVKDAVQPAIPLSEVIALETSINSNVYRTFYIQNDATETSMTRVAEGADVPRVKLTTGEASINLYKYGRSLEATYEQLRYQRLDKIALHLQLMAIQTEVDKLAQVIDIMVNGDGNANTSATSYNLTTLDSAATAGTLTLKGWLAFKMKFKNPYMVTTALAREAIALQLLMLNTGSANTPLVGVSAPSGFGYFTQINPGLRDNVALGWTDDAPANKILGFDKRLNVEAVYDVGGNIQEVERFVNRQTQSLVLTETVGFAVFDGQSARILVVNA